MATDVLFKPLPKGAISELIVDRITKAIISGDLKPGDKIPTELEFSENLSVSRNAVREAIKVLVAFGVLEIRRSEGTFVVNEYNAKLLDPMLYGILLKEHTFDELLELKLSSAYMIAILAMEKATNQEIATLRSLGEQFMEISRHDQVDEEEMYKAAIAYNQYLEGMCRNRLVTQLDQLIHKLATFTRHWAIRSSIAMGKPSALPENYLMEVEVLASRKRERIFELMDVRMALWKELFSYDPEA